MQSNCVHTVFTFDSIGEAGGEDSGTATGCEFTLYSHSVPMVFLAEDGWQESRLRSRCLPLVFLFHAKGGRGRGIPMASQLHSFCDHIVTILCSEWRGREKEGRAWMGRGVPIVFLLCSNGTPIGEGKRGGCRLHSHCVVIVFLFDEKGGREGGRGRGIPIAFRLYSDLRRREEVKGREGR